MLRYCAVALLVLAAAAGAAQAGGKEKEMRFQGQLTKDDPKDRKRNAAFKVHTVKLKAGLTYQIDMTSGYDNWLRLEDLKGKELAEDDDSGGMQNARIIFNCTRDGEYKITCTAYSPDGMGPYVLTVKTSGVAPKLVTAHSEMVAKAAPDFQAAFALNGKAVKLADLKGKVVVLHFWDVKSPQCAATFPLLAEWHKAHKPAGLEVVGVSFYNYENGQFLGFDNDSGKLTKLDQADAKSEQAMLKAFAAHHGLKHLLLVLNKQEALRAFNDYYVNGLPQFVVIDRRGMVRNILVGEKAAPSLGDEIKKLLAEK